MIKIAVFSTKPYDREFLASANDSVHELRFFEPRLTNETVSLAAGFEAVCVFVNDHASRVTTPPTTVRTSSSLLPEQNLHVTWFFTATRA
jgi:lactate dehydrogenase-like 2-hydroxyacid dehydrogenase